MSDISFECGQCHQRLTIGADGVGQSLPCPTCGAMLTVPKVAPPPPLPPPLPPPSALPACKPRCAQGLAVASLVLGISGLIPVLGMVTGVIGLVLGIVALSKRTTAKGCAIAGTVTGGLSLLLIPLYLAILIPAVAMARTAARQAVCAANLHSIGLAMADYQSKHNGALPDNLAAISQTGAVTPKMLHCPLCEQTTSDGDYVYVPALAKGMLAWDRTPHRAFGKQLVGRNVLYPDLSVRFLAETNFEKELARLECAARQATPPSGPPSVVKRLPPPSIANPGRSTAVGTGAKPVSSLHGPTTVVSPAPHVRESQAIDPTALIAALQSGDRARMSKATMQLIQHKPAAPNPAVAAALTDLLLNDTSVPLRVNAAWALESWGTAESLPALQKAAEDPNSMIQKRVKKTIAKLTANAQETVSHK